MRGWKEKGKRRERGKEGGKGRKKQLYMGRKICNASFVKDITVF